MKPFGYIYIVHCLKSGRAYVGQTRKREEIRAFEAKHNIRFTFDPDLDFV